MVPLVVLKLIVRVRSQVSHLFLNMEELWLPSNQFLWVLFIKILVVERLEGVGIVVSWESFWLVYVRVKLVFGLILKNYFIRVFNYLPFFLRDLMGLSLISVSDSICSFELLGALKRNIPWSGACLKSSNRLDGDWAVCHPSRSPASTCLDSDRIMAHR